MYKTIKQFFPYFLFLFIVFSCTFYVYAAKPITVYDTNYLIDETSETEFQEGLNNQSRLIYISNMNSKNEVNLVFYLVYKYCRDAYLQDWLYETNDIFKVIYLTNKKKGKKYYIVVTQDEKVRKICNYISF